MAKTYRMYQIDAFTKERFTGNPAGVVTNADGLTDADMQHIARELNNSETAFVFSENVQAGDVRVRFFTPTTEVPLCGHATISAHYARALEERFSGRTRVLQETGAGVLPVEVCEDEGDYRVVMTQGEISIGEPLPIEVQTRILQALGVDRGQLISELPMSIASTGHSKVMVGIRDSGRLHVLQPDLTALARISVDIGCNGYYVFTLHPDQDVLVHGRMFAPAIGIAEDPVTGNANGPLGAYLVQMGYAGKAEEPFVFEAVQGESMGRAGRISVEVDIRNARPCRVRVSGYAVVVFKMEMEL